MLSEIQYKLLQIAEEATEVAQECHKAIRFGIYNFHPDNPGITNLQRINRELTDLQASINRFNKDRMDILTTNDAEIKDAEDRMKLYHNISRTEGQAK